MKVQDILNALRQGPGPACSQCGDMVAVEFKGHASDRHGCLGHIDVAATHPVPPTPPDRLDEEFTGVVARFLADIREPDVEIGVYDYRVSVSDYWNNDSYDGPGAENGTDEDHVSVAKQVRKILEEALDAGCGQLHGAYERESWRAGIEDGFGIGGRRVRGWSL